MKDESYVESREKRVLGRRNSLYEGFEIRRKLKCLRNLKVNMVVSFFINSERGGGMR